MDEWENTSTEYLKGALETVRGVMTVATIAGDIGDPWDGRDFMTALASLEHDYAQALKGRGVKLRHWFLDPGD